LAAPHYTVFLGRFDAPQKFLVRRRIELEIVEKESSAGFFPTPGRSAKVVRPGLPGSGADRTSANDCTAAGSFSAGQQDTERREHKPKC
jgi:hypothetical protein